MEIRGPDLEAAAGVEAKSRRVVPRQKKGLAGRPRRFDRGFPSTARWLVSSIFNDGAALSRNVHAKQLQRVVYAIPENALSASR